MPCLQKRAFSSEKGESSPANETSNLPNQQRSLEGPEGNTTEMDIFVSSLLLHFQKPFPSCSTSKFYFLLGLFSATLNVTP